ncbi:hypothetical protein ACFQPF_09100 [Fictibacillus iocasae]|uniref:Uncharacterized protein n=1 Tax=Fictibacillus iocasae TaxID=2715437 RepID=A0ABW2NRA9_9BACL
MQELYFNSKMICSVTEKEYEQFKLLCPYWGLSLIEEANVILGALSTFMMGVHGLSPKKFKQLSQLLEHTGISLTNHPEASALQHLYIQLEPVHHVPLSVRTESGETFYLNPVQPDGVTSVQKSVHKHITLKPKKGKLHITISAEHETNMCEYLSYMIIQICLRKEFTSLSSITEWDYHTLNDKLLNVIAPSFSSTQKRMTAEKAVSSITRNKEPEEKAIRTDDSDSWQIAESAVYHSNSADIRSQPTRVHPINPFRQSSPQRSVISPFPSSYPKKNTDVIRPFQLNKHTPSRGSEYSNHTFLNFKKGRGKDE